MERYIITIADGKDEYALNLAQNELVDLTDYACRSIGPDQLKEIRMLARSNPNYQTIVEILERGLELHIWRRNGH